MQHFYDFLPECRFCPCCKLLQWVRAESGYQVHYLHFWSRIFHNWCYKICHFISTCSFRQFNSSSKPSEIKNSAVVDKLHKVQCYYHIIRTDNNTIKTGATWINQGHCKLYHKLPTYDFPLVVNSDNYGHKYIEPFQRLCLLDINIWTIFSDIFKFLSRSSMRHDAEHATLTRTIQRKASETISTWPGACHTVPQKMLAASPHPQLLHSATDEWRLRMV